jgi:hypothetical protein
MLNKSVKTAALLNWQTFSFASRMKTKNLFRAKNVIKIPRSTIASPIKMAWPGSEKKPAILEMKRLNTRVLNIKK